MKQSKYRLLFYFEAEQTFFCRKKQNFTQFDIKASSKRWESGAELPRFEKWSGENLTQFLVV